MQGAATKFHSGRWVDHNNLIAKETDVLRRLPAPCVMYLWCI
jgi:hypothetical protein